MVAETRESARRGSRLVGIEGLRAVAATAVLAYHVWLYGAPDGRSVDLGPASQAFSNLRAGVTLFFALSGFLLFRPYVAAAIRGLPTPSYRAYFRNRALRILPAYWVILLVVLLVVERELLQDWRGVAANVLFLQNYAPEYIHTGIVPAWSLAIEVVFYLAVPVLGALALRLMPLKRRAGLLPALAPALLMLAIGLGTKVAIRAFDLDRVWQLSFLAHADWFAAGMTVAVLRVYWEDGRLELGRHWRPIAAAGAVAFALAGALSYDAGVLTSLECQTPIAVACGLVLALVVFAEPGSRLVAVLSWRPIFAAGLASYGVFLWHDPLLRWLRDLGVTASGVGGMVANGLLVAALTAALSTVTYLYVERPALARKRTWQRGREREAAPVETPPAGAAAAARLR